MPDDSSGESHPTSIFEVSAFNPAARDDPHTGLKALREHCPVMRDDMAKTWFLTRYGDIRETVNDRSLVRYPSKAEEGSINRRFAGADGTMEAEPSILFLDDPDHARIRLPLAKAFYGRIQKMKTEIEAIIDGIISSAPATGTFDLMSEIAVPIPVLVIARILGVDESRLADFREWSEGVILSLNPLRSPEETETMERAAEALNAYFDELIAARRASPQDDLVSDMVQLQSSGEADLSDEELRRNLEALLVGGNLTTTDLIGNGVWLFLTHPEQLNALKADPGMAGPAVEEVLRFEAPVSATSRILPDSREIAGCPMTKSQTVFLSLAAANRDPATFDQPDAFDITIKRPSHVAFGGGPHICIGAPLARIEARHVYVKLFERYPDLKLAGQDIAWRTLPFFRGIETLLVEA